jgi:channel protein (hemolysin III family)
MRACFAQAVELYHLPGVHEPFSSFSHLFGALLFLLLGFHLLQRGRGDRTRLIYLGIYAASCVLLLSMSGVYHMLERGTTAHNVLGRLDHGAIFVLIAGTFTPAHGILCRGRWRWAPLAFVWTVAATGITLKAVFYDDLPYWSDLTFYLGLGWLGGITALYLGRRYGFAFIKPLLFGGIAYTAGAMVEVLHMRSLIPGVVNAHEILHIADLVGASFHFYFIWQFAAGMPPVTREVVPQAVPSFGQS